MDLDKNNKLEVTDSAVFLPANLQTSSSTLNVATFLDYVQQNQPNNYLTKDINFKSKTIFNRMQENLLNNFLNDNLSNLENKNDVENTFLIKKTEECEKDDNINNNQKIDLTVSNVESELHRQLMVR